MKALKKHRGDKSKYRVIEGNGPTEYKSGKAKTAKSGTFLG